MGTFAYIVLQLLSALLWTAAWSVEWLALHLAGLLSSCRPRRAEGGIAQVGVPPVGAQAPDALLVQLAQLSHCWSARSQLSHQRIKLKWVS